MNDSAGISKNLYNETANSLSHGLGVIFGVIFIPILIATALKNPNPMVLAGASIYGLSYMMVFTFSTLYHGMERPNTKRILEVLDHISIYFLIAGSYTPFVFLYMYNPTGILLLEVLWGLTLAGTVFKIIFVDRYDYFSLAIYVFMGWALLPVAKTFFSNMPEQVRWLIVAGGISYSIGVVFYLWQTLRHQHVVWHLLVLTGSILHFFAIWKAVS